MCNKKFYKSVREDRKVKPWFDSSQKKITKLLIHNVAGCVFQR